MTCSICGKNKSTVPFCRVLGIHSIEVNDLYYSEYRNYGKHKEYMGKIDESEYRRIIYVADKLFNPYEKIEDYNLLYNKPMEFIGRLGSYELFNIMKEIELFKPSRNVITEYYVIIKNRKEST